uniref:Solute carrier family 35 n=1 Tax=Amphidinium carterae TaxID=2961 RepID=A7YXE8_AMPCA|nr:solute carrier family 35 [Amphidinium carterae]
MPDAANDPGTAGLLFGAAGIYAAFLYYGSLMEDVFAFKSADGEQFQQAWFLQAIEALANVAVGLVGMLIQGPTSGLPKDLFAVSGLTQVAAKVCTTKALAVGLSFPVATLAKSAKMAPVMAGSLVLGGASYSLREYLQVLAIILGTVLVSMKGKSSSGSSTLFGVLYICGSLALDGLTGGVQSRLKAKQKEKGVVAKPYDFMFWTNLFMMLVAVVVSTGLGETFSGWAFVMAHPAILTKVLLFAACSAFGQSFIFYTISNYGPLKVAGITTTRKIFSVLLSIFLKGHKLSLLNWAGIAVGSIGIAGELLPKGKKTDKKS